MKEFDACITEAVAHRPWPLPSTPWVMRRTLHDVLLIHWPVNPARIRSRVPAEFEVDLFDGSAWLSMAAFHVTNVGPRALSAAPVTFSELTVRTYVRVADRPGVYFFSLDADSRLAVAAATYFLNLPYREASMDVSSTDGEFSYRSVRRRGTTGQFAATYRPAEPLCLALPGSLEYFLTERYCLYHLTRRGIPYRVDTHHRPWSLRNATAEFARNTMADVNGLPPCTTRPILQYAKRQDVVAWAPSTTDAHAAWLPTALPHRAANTSAQAPGRY